jgi:hypothetical protein
MMTVKNGLYSIRIEMKDGGRGRATGVIVLLDGQILGGDTHFYYAGSYTFKNGKWRGELITHQHTEALGMTLLFAGRETCGFTGTYSDGKAEVDGTARVGKNSVPFHAKLTLKSSL